MSLARIWEAHAEAACLSSRSPAWCPRSSLNCLKRSRSSIATQTERESRAARASSRGSSSSQARRFGNPVRSSVRAVSWSWTSSRARSSAIAASADSICIPDSTPCERRLIGFDHPRTSTATALSSRITGSKCIDRTHRDRDRLDVGEGEACLLGAGAELGDEGLNAVANDGRDADPEDRCPPLGGRVLGSTEQEERHEEDRTEPGDPDRELAARSVERQPEHGEHRKSGVAGERAALALA